MQPGLAHCRRQCSAGQARTRPRETPNARAVGDHAGVREGGRRAAQNRPLTFFHSDLAPLTTSPAAFVTNRLLLWATSTKASSTAW